MHVFLLRLSMAGFTPMTPPSARIHRVWIGGSPCSGKSTIATLLARAAGTSVYSCDDGFERHSGEAADGPTLRKLSGLSIEQRLAQPVDVQVADVIQAYREEFPLIRRDLTDHPSSTVVEGAALLPELLAAEQVRPEHAVWIVPSEEFQREHYRQRSWAWELLRPVADPEAAFERWMARDARFAAIVAGQARELGYRVLITDGRRSATELAEVAFRH
jgi:2-phosphoglycerate kinase